MRRVDVYGGVHSPWVQAVLLELHDAGIPHSLTSVPPLETFFKSGVTMPAARIDDGHWQLESADILRNVGFDSITGEQMQLVRRAWQGVLHRADSAALFWGGFSLAGDSNPSSIRRLANNFLRSFVTLFFLLIRSVVRLARPADPPNFGDLSALRSIGGGGAAMTRKHSQRIDERSNNQVRASAAYGRTETNGLAASNAGANLRGRPNSCGKVLPHLLEIRITGRDGNELPCGSPVRRPRPHG